MFLRLVLVQDFCVLSTQLSYGGAQSILHTNEQLPRHISNIVVYAPSMSDSKTLVSLSNPYNKLLPPAAEENFRKHKDGRTGGNRAKWYLSSRMGTEFEEESRKPALTPELEEKIVKRVRKILKKANLYQMSEKKVREEAASDLGIDLSEEPFKSVVRQAVAGFLQQVQRERAQAKEEVQKQEKSTSK